MGVTDSTEDNGDNDRHKVDNIGGSNNYVLFEFSAPVVVDQALLDLTGADSDMSAWVGTKPDPINNHLTLSDALLSSLGPREDNSTDGSAPRWADINASQKAGNVLVISALVGDTTPEDAFKIHKVKFCHGGAPTPTPTPTPSCPTISLSPSTLPSGTAGQPYSKTITASGGSCPYTFTVSSGSLPNGLTLSSGGVLSGTPTSSGSFTFTIKAMDNRQCSGSRQYTVPIVCSSITVSPSTLSDGVVGQSYSKTITASGGSSPYTFTVLSGSLPTGLTLSSGGVLSGTPTVYGTFTFTIQANDNRQCTGSRAYSLVISHY